MEDNALKGQQKNITGKRLIVNRKSVALAG
jgi:hypothetical protein